MIQLRVAQPEYDRILQYVRMTTVTTGHTLHAHRARIKDVYFPIGGVFSVTNDRPCDDRWQVFASAAETGSRHV